MRRIAWRAVKKSTNMYRKYNTYISEYRSKLEEECVDICKDMLTLIQKHLLPKAKKFGGDESEVYYRKLQADYYRYVAEVGTAKDRIEKAKTRALSCYDQATQLADKLSPADPVRLSLCLNFSVYCFEIYGSQEQKERAVEIAKQGIETAEEDLENLDSQKASESEFILKFMRENLNNWRDKIKKVNASKRNLFSQ